MRAYTFNPIDLHTWERAKYFDFFEKNGKAEFSITAQTDITALLPVLKKRGVKFYDAYLYIITTVINSHENFRVAYKGGVLGIWDKLLPDYAVMQPDKTLSCLWSDCSDSFAEFTVSLKQDFAQYGSVHEFTAKPGRPANCYIVSCSPWVSFTALTPMKYYDDHTNFFPTVTAGKYFEQSNKILLPLSFVVPHSVCDGYHTGLFFDGVQRLCDSAQDWIDR